MKFTSIHLEETIIEIYNSFFGKETIKVNHEIVSEKYSIFGGEHVFAIEKEGSEADYYCIEIGMSLYGVVFNLYKNDEPIIVSF